MVVVTGVTLMAMSSGFLTLLNPKIANHRTNISSIASSMRQYLASQANFHKSGSAGLCRSKDAVGLAAPSECCARHLLRGIDLPEAHCT